MALAVSLPASAQVDPVLEMLRNLDPPDAVLRYGVTGRETAVQPWDIAAVELSESGGITDIIIRLMPKAALTLETSTARAVGKPMIVRLCGHVLRDTVMTEANVTGALYLPNTTAARGEALRALWQGRARCDTVAPEVFADGP